jgi:hypothetical protein
MRYRLQVIWRALCWLLVMCLIPGYHRAARTYYECFPKPLGRPPEPKL